MAEVGEKPNNDSPIESEKDTKAAEIVVAPLREDFIQNAVNFLKHPNVRGSPVKYRRSFLEKKGLTAEEIDEAFRRVPDTADNGEESPAFPPVTQKEQPAKPTQAVQMYPPKPYQSATQLPPQPAPVSNVSNGMKWPQMVFAMGVIGAGGAATAILAQNYILPWVKSFLETFLWGKKDENATREAALQAAKAASETSTAVQELIKLQSEGKQQTDQLVKSIETQSADLRSTLNSLEKSFSEKVQEKDNISVADLRKELRSFAAIMSEFSPDSSSVAEIKSELDGIKQILKSVTSTGGSGLRLAPNGPIGSPIPSPVPLPVPGSIQSSQLANGSSFPHERASPQLSYNQIMEMVQRGEKPPGIQEIDDKPKDPTVPISSSNLAPRPKPWEKAPQAQGIPPWQSVPPNAVSPSVGSSGSFQDSSWWQRKGQVQYNEWGAPIYPQAIPSGSQVHPNGAVMSEVGENENPAVQSVEVQKSVSPVNSGWNPPPVPKASTKEALEAIKKPRSAIPVAVESKKEVPLDSADVSGTRGNEGASESSNAQEGIQSSETVEVTEA